MEDATKQARKWYELGNFSNAIKLFSEAIDLVDDENQDEIQTKCKLLFNRATCYSKEVCPEIL